MKLIDDLEGSKDMVDEIEYSRIKRGCSRPFWCERCPFKTLTLEKLVDHLVHHRERAGSFKCTYCDFRTSKTGIGKHIAIHHRRQEVKRVSNKFGCDPKLIVFIKEQDLEVRVREPSDGDNVTCVRLSEYFEDVEEKKHH